MSKYKPGDAFYLEVLDDHLESETIYRTTTGAYIPEHILNWLERLGTVEDVKIEDCPFCGSEAVLANIAGSSYVTCTNDDCAAMGPFAESEMKAVEKWNHAAEMITW